MSVFVVIEGKKLRVDKDVLVSKYHDDIEKIDRSFYPHTKDITLPDTLEVRKAFGHINNRFVEGGKYRYQASIEKEEQEVFKGDLVILEVEETNARKVGSYDCQMIAGLGNVIEKAKNTKLMDMGFDNLVIDEAVIVNSWIDKDAEYFWWFLDKGRVDFDLPSIKTEVTDYRPFVYSKKLIERFLKEQGYYVSWNGNFVNTEEFNQICITDNSPIVYLPAYRGSMNTLGGKFIGSMSKQTSGTSQLFYGAPDFRVKQGDEDGLMNIGTGKFQCNLTGRYNVSMSFDLMFMEDYIWTLAFQSIGKVRMELYNDTDGVVELFKEVPMWDNAYGFYSKWINKGFNHSFGNIQLINGKKYSTRLKVTYERFYGSIVFASPVLLNMTYSTMNVESLRLSANVGKSMPLVSVYDLIKSLSAFNIITDVDRNLNTINIWQWDDYVKSGKVHNWTKKIVRENAIRHENIGQSKYSELKFEWASDSGDSYLKHIQDNDGQPLGDYIEAIKDSVANNSVNVFKGEFAATGMKRSASNLWMPKISIDEPDGQIVPRILIFGQMQPSNNFYVKGKSFTIQSASVPEVYFYKEYSGPNDLVLNFNNLCNAGLRKQTRDVGLVERLWRGKLDRFFYGSYITVEMLLSYLDYYTTNLNDTIVMEDNSHILVKIDKYNLSRDTTTTVELIQL